MLAPSGLAAQSIVGRLLDTDRGTPIDLGVLVLLTIEGDTVALTASDPAGRFELTAPEPGAFFLRASAWGYSEKEDGVFELAADSRLEVDFRIAPRAIDLEGILVTTDRPAPDHPLVRSGFVARYQRGLGHFISPRDLERTVFIDTEALFRFVPGVRVVSVTMSAAGGSMVGTDIEQIVMRSPFHGWCTPTVFMDGVRVPYRPGDGTTLSKLVPLHSVAAAEVYRNPAVVPPQFGAVGECGALIFWTKR